MLAYLLKRLALGGLTTLGVLTAVFIAMRVLPGDPALAIAGMGATPQEIAAIRADLGLEQPLAIQYLHYLGGLLSGNLGVSYYRSQPVAAELLPALRASLLLVVLAGSLAALLGLALGALAAARPGSPLDLAVAGFVTLGICVPPFFLALLLVFVFAVRLRVLPAVGSGTPAHLVLPALTIALFAVAHTTKITRNSLLDTLAKEFIRTARAKGLRSSVIMVRHALPNALPAVATVIGLQITAMLGGLAVVEVVFAYPGVGALLVQGIARRDLPVVQAATILIALSTVLVNLAVDCVQALFDPRFRERLAG